MVKHIANAVHLKPEFLLEFIEDTLDLFFRQRDLIVGGPCRVWFA